jgi:hypothetical protein
MLTGNMRAIKKIAPGSFIGPRCIGIEKRIALHYATDILDLNVTCVAINAGLRI